MLRSTLLAFGAGLVLTGCNLVVGIDPWGVGGAAGTTFASTIAASDGSTSTDASSTSSGCVICDSGCVDLNLDATNCGACGKACFGAATCSMGRCEAALIGTLDKEAFAIATTRTEVVVATPKRAVFLSKTGAATVEFPFPGGSIGAVTGAPGYVLAAGTDAVYRATASGGFVVDRTYNGAAELKPAWIRVNGGGSTSFNEPTDVHVGSNAVVSTRRPVLIGASEGNDLSPTGCTTANDQIRGSVGGAGNVIAVASNNEVVACGSAKPWDPVDGVTDVAALPTLGQFYVARTGTSSGIELRDIDGAVLKSFLHDSTLTVSRMALRENEIFVLVQRMASLQVELRRYVFGNDAGETLYSSGLKLVDIVVDPDGVYVLDDAGHVYAVAM